MHNKLPGKHSDKKEMPMTPFISHCCKKSVKRNTLMGPYALSFFLPFKIFGTHREKLVIIPTVRVSVIFITRKIKYNF